MLGAIIKFLLRWHKFIIFYEMSNIVYFQRYSQRENWITNNTLLLLSRLQEYNPNKFQLVLNELFTEHQVNLSIGVSFFQQRKGDKSVIDGLMFQQGFKVAIETKRHDNFTVNQLRNQLELLRDEKGLSVLLALSKNKVDAKTNEAVLTHIKGTPGYDHIKFASTSYEDLATAVQNSLNDADIEMQLILDDYVSFCQEEGLFDITDKTMLAVTAGQSYEENIKYRLYYDPASRSHNIPFRYLGLYRHKAINVVGEVTKVVYCDYVDGILVAQPGFNLANVSDDEKERIIACIENTPYYDLRNNTKFYLVDNYYQTSFIKSSFSSLRAKRYFFLNEIDGFQVGMTGQQVADILVGKEF